MKRFLCALSVLLALNVPAWADSTIDLLGAGAGLAGTEKIPMFQTANPAVTTTPNALDTYLSQTTKTLTNKTLTSPIMTGPVLGTPASGTLTNATGLPISTGVSGLGTGIATALAVNAGTAGSPVINGGVLGTPSSGTLTNLTGLPVSTGISGLGTSVATALAVNVGSAGAFAKNNGDALSGTYTGTPTFSGNLTFSGVPIFSGAAAGTIAAGKNLGLDASNNLVTATVAGGSSSGYGVDGGTSAQSLTANTIISNGTRLVKIGTLASPVVFTLPAISAVSADTCIRFEDAAANVTNTNTVTITANVADGINNGAGGSSTVAYGTSGLGVSLCVSATHNWNIDGSQLANPSSGQIYIGSAAGFPVPQTLSQDCTLVAAGTITCTKTNNVSFGAGATAGAASTSTAGIAKLHNVGESVGWVATVNPNNAVIAVINQASTVSAIVGAVETATGGAATVTVNKAPSGTACSAGTALHSGTFNANGTAATNQTLTVTTSSLAAGDRLCLQTTGTTAWTGGTGIGTITVFLAPS